MNKRVGRSEASPVRWCLVLAAMAGCASPSVSPPPPPGEKPLSLTANGAPTGKGADAAGSPTDVAAAPSPYASDRIVATISDGRFQRHVTMDQVLKPLIEAHGLNMLLVVVQLELAKGLAERAGIRVTEADISAERDATLTKLFSENDERLDTMIAAAKSAKKTEKVEQLEKQKLSDRDLLLKQFLEQQRISPSELDLVLTTNVYLRKVAEPQVANQIKEEDVRREFAIRFNEQIKARHIQLKRPQDTTEVLRRLKEGQPFEQVARDLSTNPTTAALGGELPPFGREDARLPQNFKDVAFSLKDGQVSDVVEWEGSYHIIKAEHRIQPRVVKFEDVAPGLRRDLTERVTQAVVTRIRADIGQVARTAMKINDPELERQFKQKIKSFEDQQAAADKAKADMEKDRAKTNGAATRATDGATPGQIGPKAGPAPSFGDGPATAPTTVPVAPPAAAPAAPPATATKPAGPSTRPVGSPK
ncbi:peptidylprolyl isomerase [Humisphaera borealis]|uniref:peptidylprolyl isomerase n=1 Tax=Humisphaera borealis TaxID=2807512 RepID=A0A7M2X3T6_9BACT|nr:peptidylprolyl isomerase [Humisphaera borealis]QOV91430.1 peptidylprolyl isomerase [Humisphaera borealis]